MSITEKMAPRVLDGRVALVTGAGQGNGRAIALGLARAGASVVATDVDTATVRQTAADIKAAGGRAWSYRLDVTNAAECTALAATVAREIGRIDLLVNNAGIPKRRRVEATSDAELDQVVAINFLSPVRLTTALLPRMLERGRGQILNVSSVAARLSPPGEAAYAASKAALTAWSESLAVELWDTPVSVHLLNPGVVDTELFHLPDNDPMLAEVEALPTSAVVDVVVDQLASGDLERYVPEWFGDVALMKANDLTGYLTGSAEWYRDALAQKADGA